LEFRKRTREFESSSRKEISRYKKIKEKAVEARTWGIGHGIREVGRKTSSGRVKIKHALSVI
jgi:hypothetical protein